MSSQADGPTPAAAGTARVREGEGSGGHPTVESNREADGIGSCPPTTSVTGQLPVPDASATPPMSTATVTRVNIISGPGIPVQGMPVEGVPIAHADGMPFYAPGRAVQMAPIGGRRGGAHVMYPHGGQSAAYHYDMGSHASAYPHPGMGGEGHSLADAVITEQQAAMELIPQFMARQLSRSLKLFSVIDILLCVLYVFGQFSFAAFAVIGPLCGYYGAKNYQRPYVACYILFCIINTAWRLAVFIFARSLLSQVIGMLMVMVEIYITRLVVRFYNLLKSFTDDELLELRITSNMPVQMVFW